MGTCPNQVWLHSSNTDRRKTRNDRSTLLGCLRHPLRRRCPLVVSLLVVVALPASFVAYERVGTHANVSVVKYADDAAGGFLAVGYSETQPGILVASALDRSDVRIDTHQTSYLLAGTHTDVDIVTPSARCHKRLRGPLVITIDASGGLTATTVDWPVHTMRTIAEAADCHELSTLMEKHCGALFLDIRARMDKWPPDTVPLNLRAFLANTP